MNEKSTELDSWGKPRRPGDSYVGARLIQELVDLAEESSLIPLGAVVILMPSVDEPDPELAAANMRRAKELIAEGRTVVLWIVGKEPPYTIVPAVPALTTIAET